LYFVSLHTALLSGLLKGEGSKSLYYAEFLKAAFNRLIDIGYLALILVACFAVGGMLIMSLVAFVLQSWMPVIVGAVVFSSIIIAMGIVFILISTIQWLQDKDSLW
jgi:hypothetical protein